MYIILYIFAVEQMLECFERLLITVEAVTQYQNTIRFTYYEDDCDYADDDDSDGGDIVRLE